MILILMDCALPFPWLLVSSLRLQRHVFFFLSPTVIQGSGLLLLAVAISSFQWH